MGPKSVNSIFPKLNVGDFGPNPEENGRPKRKRIFGLGQFFVFFGRGVSNFMLNSQSFFRVRAPVFGPECEH